jgi:hybrid cluster-associated redox disulfide protein
MQEPSLEASMTVAEVLDHWPQTIPVFIRYRMACVGCAMAPYETLAEVASIYHLDMDGFLRELGQSIEAKADRRYVNITVVEANNE